MLMEKLSSGVLRVLTPLGPRYLRPSLAQRLQLMWVFRNFATLPAKVLTARQLRLIDTMCAQNRFIAFNQNGWQEAPILGTLEQRPPAQSTPTKIGRSNASLNPVTPFAADSATSNE
jgi:hypothetical protein